MDRMKFAHFGYRSWAQEIYKNLESAGFEIDSLTTPKSEYAGSSSRIADPAKLRDFDARDYGALLFYGWSWKVPEELFKSVPCVCLHPSPLPRYRGGSPLQHQIIAGEDESAVTLLKMGEKMDAGPIYYQQGFSLAGSLEEIFGRIVNVGTELSTKLLQDFASGRVNEHPQDESLVTTYLRRKHSESELTEEMLRRMSPRQIEDFIRALQPPYPQAYVMKGCEKVYLTHPEDLE
jgi:methionyl-tRNA formyltransferase